MSVASDTDDPAGSATHRLRARYVFTNDAAPVEHGVVVIESGRVADVHSRADSTAVDLGNVALIPGLVNAHTHLEFSDLAEPLSPPDRFLDWIRAVVAHRGGRVESTETIVAAGLRESIDSGTTALGEIATADSSDPVIVPPPATIVCFRELIGFDSGRIESQMDIARRHLAARSQSRVVRGISPHAPYSVHPELFRRLVRLAEEFRAPVAMHLAETTDEIEFFESGTGRFVDFLKQFGIWEPNAVASGTRPLDYLRELAKVDRALAIHGNYLNNEEIAFLAANPQVALVFCPRTHAYFRHSPHPWRQILEQGGRVAIGTDSRASNPDLSLWRELRFLRKRNPDVDAAELIQYGTINGALALGIEDETGSLLPGKSADLAVVPLAERSHPGDMFDCEIDGVMSAGRWVAGSGQ